MTSSDAAGTLLEKRKVRASFERSAPDYDRVAVLQRTVGKRLMEHLDPVRLNPKIVLDVGVGTGEFLRPLSRRFPKAKIIGLDIAESMLHQARGKAPRLLGKPALICADAERLPMCPASVDLLFSNLTLQWCNDLDRTYKELVYALAPGGLLQFSTLGPDTLHELRHSWAVADGYSHVNAFFDLHDVGDGLVRAGLIDVVVDVERITRTYDDVFALMRELKTLGAKNANVGRRRGLTGKKRMQAVVTAYESFRVDGMLPATYEVVYAHGWAPGADQAWRRRTALSLNSKSF